MNQLVDGCCGDFTPSKLQFIAASLRSDRISLLDENEATGSDISSFEPYQRCMQKYHDKIPGIK